MVRCVVLVCVVACVALAKATGAEEPLFPFVISFDAPANVTNVSGWLPTPAGKGGFVRAEGEHLATDQGRIRFWATNLCFDACFPEKPMAERVAARLARLGINCVRLHHMDSRSIWGKSPNKTIIDPERLDRLDYLIAQLKRHGIYVNINLHVSRWLGDEEGFPHRNDRPKYDKGIGNFEPRMIELQKKYARDLLTHVNPYTKTAYTDEPAVAFVEISNEDALFVIWGRGQLDDLPDPYATTYRSLWNAWLRAKYKTTDALRKVWNVGRKELGAELLANGGFAKPLDGSWVLELGDDSKATWAIVPDGPGGKPFLRLRVDHMGVVSWRPQFMHLGFAVKKDEPYTLRFRIRSDKDRRASVNCIMAHEPWNRLGLSSGLRVSPKWSEHTLVFVASVDDPEARITFSSLEAGATYELAGVSLRPGGIVGIEPGQSLEDNSVPVLKHGQMNLTTIARNDFIDFLWDTERSYWHGMYRFLKDELKVKSIVSGTQLSYSPVHIQAALDYIDAHSYWHHPHFPGRPWDSNNWYVRNRALVNHPGGTLAGLAARRVDGKAYTCSEYNHPAPNAYAGEGFPMIAAFGAFQDWDGIFPFAYCHNHDFEPRRITSYFDYKGDPQKIATQIACAALFARGDVQPARSLLVAPLTFDAERQKLHESHNAWGLTATRFGLDGRHALLHRMAIDLTGKAKAATPPELPDDQKVFVSDTGELRWDASQEGAGVFTVDTARSKLFTGFPRGRTFDLGGVSLAIGDTRMGWATITMTCIDGSGFDKPGLILIAALGRVENTGWQLESLGDDRITLRRKWGAEPVVCEGVPAAITLPVAPGRVTLYPLDEQGARRAAVPVAARDGKAVVTLGPKHKTIWYEVEVR